MKEHLRRCRDSLYLVYGGMLLITLYDDQILFNDKVYRPIEGKQSCSFESTNLYDAFIFFPVHLINWFFASLIARDFIFLHAWSIFDEIIETSYQQVIPVVEECWWDRAILDILVANNFSIWFGMWVSQKYLKLEPFDWFGRRGFYNPFKWQVFQDENRLMIVVMIFLCIKINFIAGFLLIYSLNIEVFHWFCFFRLLLWFTLGYQCFEKNYAYIMNGGVMPYDTKKINIILADLILLEGIVIGHTISYQTGLKHISELSPLTPLFWQITGMALFVGYRILKSRNKVPYSYLKEALAAKNKQE